jgi:lipopolysaccharide biosynthesis glycosyltransferase
MFSATPSDLYAIHYVRGKKPWKCFRDYDCNFNADQHYASDEAHAQWFKVHPVST